MQQRVPCQPGRTTYTATVPGLPTNSAVDFRVRAISLQNQPSNPSPEVIREILYRPQSAIQVADGIVS